jgi:hypothetical protein
MTAVLFVSLALAAVLIGVLMAAVVLYAGHESEERRQ